MPYLIDGHNLIPKVPGLTLGAMDDEIQLIDQLQEFCRRQRKEVEVYFDNAPPGQAQVRKFGMVSARFVRQGMTADEAIRNRLRRLGKDAHNWTVVSSDRAVQSAARAARAHFLSSEAFASLLMQIQEGEAARDIGERPDAELGPDEVDRWMRLFGLDEEDQ